MYKLYRDLSRELKRDLNMELRGDLHWESSMVLDRELFEELN